MPIWTFEDDRNERSKAAEWGKGRSYCDHGSRRHEEDEMETWKREPEAFSFVSYFEMSFRTKEHWELALDVETLGSIPFGRVEGRASHSKLLNGRSCVPSCLPH